MSRKKASTGKAAPGKLLHHALSHSKQIKERVGECADELSAVNGVFNAEQQTFAQQPHLLAAAEKNGMIESKVQDCADELLVVAEVLKAEIAERYELEQQLSTSQEQEQASRHASLHDPLTGLPNRALFNDHLEHGIAQANRHDWMLAVMFIDLDSFKLINDTHGHATGDEVLRIVAARLRKMTRDVDTVSRRGGDEFLCLLTELKAEAEVLTVAEKLVAAFSAPLDIVNSDAPVSLIVTLSIGVAVYPLDGQAPEELVACADKAMYRAKRHRSGYAFCR